MEKGEIDSDIKATCELQLEAYERWNGHRGFGPLNARQAMERACELAKQYGIGMVALANNNHWMRGGSYGLQAADPGEIYKTKRVLPMGFWKGSGISIALDMIASVLTAENAVHTIGTFEDEIGLSQMMIAIDPSKANTEEQTDAIVDGILAYIKASKPIDEARPVLYPGEPEWQTMEEHRKNGIPVIEEKWNMVLAM